MTNEEFAKRVESVRTKLYKTALLKFTGDEVWLSPHYSHNWVAEDLIVISIQ